MAVRDIIRMGHPTLRKVARPLTDAEIGSAATQTLVQDLTDTLRATGMGIGLAAPQIDEPVRVAVIEIPGGASRYGEIPPLPLTVFINPEIEVLNPAVAGYWEGCLSVPGLRGFVERPQHIRIRALGLDGAPLELTLQGFVATVFQHEFDHLDGRLYIDRIKDSTLLMFEEEFERYVVPGTGAL
ncbi:MAG: peptide deformylase [Pseudomonadales bacterium]